MREHLGVDVDAIYEEDLMANEPEKAEHEQEVWDPESQQQHGKEEGVTKLSKSSQRTPAGTMIRDGVDALRQGELFVLPSVILRLKYLFSSCSRHC